MSREADNHSLISMFTLSLTKATRLARDIILICRGTDDHTAPHGRVDILFPVNVGREQGHYGGDSQLTKFVSVR